MPDDPSGTYSLPEAAFTAGTVAESARINNNFSDIATALTDRVTRDGAGSMSGNLAMGSNRITGLSVGTARTDAAALAQLQDGGALWGGTAGGTADARTVTLSPAITAYAAGQRFAFINGAAANTGAATLNINGVGALAIRKGDGSVALAAGDLPASALITVQHDGTVFRLISATYTAAQGLAALGGATAGAVTGSGLTMATARLLGRTTASTGAVEEISVGARLTFSGGTLSADEQAQKYVDRAHTSYATSAAITTPRIPFDDTIPQVGEGTQILSAAITPKSASNRVRARVQATGATDVDEAWCIALFRNGGANALAATWVQNGADKMLSAVIDFEDVPGSTSAQTYTVRAAASSTATLRLNGVSSARRGGGSMAATLILEEITP